MSSKEVSLTSGQLLFDSGDDSDGMYIVMLGKLQIYLMDGEKEVILSEVGSREIIGEMALFDQKPRSASVKAIEDSKLTFISIEDFERLMTQTPQWLKMLFSTLSSRVRAANQQLQRLKSQSGTAINSMKAVSRILHVLDLIWSREGAKVDKDWVLEKKKAVEEICDVFSEERSFVEKLIDVLVKYELFKTRKDSYQNDVIAIPNKAALSKFLDFFELVLKKLKDPCLSDSAIDFLERLQKIGESSPYDAFSVRMTELVQDVPNEAEEKMSEWNKVLPKIELLHPKKIELFKESEGAVIKGQKKELFEIVRYNRLLNKISKAI